MALSWEEEGLWVAHAQPVSQGLWPVTVCGLTEASRDDPTTLVKVARSLAFERHRLSLLLAPHEYQMLAVDAPNVPPEELKAAVRWKVKDLLDVHVDDATLDVLDIPADPDAPRRPGSMYVVAAKNDILRAHIERFEQAGVNLDAIDIPEMAHRNLAARLAPPGRAVALLGCDNEGCLLTFTYAGELCFARRIDVSRHGLEAAEGEYSERRIERIALELQRALDHFERQFSFAAVAKLLVGPGPDAKNWLEALKSALYVPVEVLDLGQIFDFSRVARLSDPAEQGRAFAVLGASLREEKRAP